MVTAIAIFLDAYAKTWNLCLAFLAFFVAVAAGVWFLKADSLDVELPPRPVFWASIIPGFILLSVSLTLIDKPHFQMTEVTAEWLFMFSAFLGIPVALPFLAGAIWASAHAFQGMTIRVSSLALVMLGTFGIACATSNVHDLIWCGAITEGYTQHFKAGYDLDFFVAAAQPFGITREIAADYATLGPCALVLIIGEILVAVTCFLRMKRLGD